MRDHAGSSSDLLLSSRGTQGTVFDNISLQADAKEGVIDVTWATVHADMRLFHEHHYVLHKIAKKLDAYWEDD